MFDDVNDKSQAQPPTTPDPNKVQSTPTSEPTPVAGNDGVTPPAIQEKDKKAEAAEKESIHTMPMEYYLGDKTVTTTNAGKPIEKKTQPGPTPQVKVKPQMSSAGGSKKFLFAIVIIVLVLMLSVGGFFLYQSFVAPNDSDKPVVTKTSTLADVQEEVQVEKDVPAEEDVDEDIADEEVEEDVDEQDESPQFDPAALNKYTLDVLRGSDNDNDGLTDAEEALFGTNEGLMDSDGDVYKDKEEIQNFYSPITAEAVRLWDEDVVDYYTNTKYGYKILYPTTWLIQAVDPNDSDDLMISSNQNEFVNILVYEKPATQNIENWYLGMATSAKKSQLKKYTNYNELNVLESPDGFTVYIESKMRDRVFAVNYNIGLQEKANFPTVFGVIVNSFEFVDNSAMNDLAPIDGGGTVDPAIVVDELTVDLETVTPGEDSPAAVVPDVLP
jgi:hypothetical protein